MQCTVGLLAESSVHIMDSIFRALYRAEISHSVFRHSNKMADSIVHYIVNMELFQATASVPLKIQFRSFKLYKTFFTLFDNIMHILCLPYFSNITRIPS